MARLPGVVNLEMVRTDAGSDEATRAAYAADHGFGSWAELEDEVAWRDLLNARDLDGLAAVLTERPERATTPLRHWRDHRGDDTLPLTYIAMLRFDAERLGLAPVTSGTADVARLLIEAGAPVDGDPGCSETPLMTAASYGDADVVATLAAGGADLDARAQGGSGGVPGGTALTHAAVFGMTDVVDVLVRAGATISGLGDAAAAGDVSAWLPPAAAGPSADELAGALIIAVECGRVDAVRRLLEHGADVDRRHPQAEQTPREALAGQMERGGDPGTSEAIAALFAP